jgi:probable phosphoglycerate mutase
MSDVDTTSESAVLEAALEAPRREVVVVRHAQTEWSVQGRHTGRSDIPLTAHGRALARALGSELRDRDFRRVLSSPARRARETCELCGYGAYMQAREELWEWDYGSYEGLTIAQIQAVRPGWSLWRDGCPEGENAADVGARVDRLIAEVGSPRGNVAIFSHGHLLRVLAARWIDMSPENGARFALSTGSISVLGYERETAVVREWNLSRATPD